VPAVREVVPSAIVISPGQAAPPVPRASEAEAASKPAAGQPSAASAEAGVQEVTPQARLALPGAGKYPRAPLFQPFFLCILIFSFLPFSKRR
jgi:hypothetical protein